MSSVGSRGWLSRKDGEWEPCDLIDQNDSQLRVQISGKVEVIEIRKCKFFLRNPENVEAIDDLLQLPYLDEPNILHSLVNAYY